MQTLIEYLEARNAEIRAWVNEDPDYRWASMYVTDLAHWAGYGITTVEEFELWEMREQFSDLYKNVHGVRPRHININELSVDELRLRIDELFCGS